MKEWFKSVAQVGEIEDLASSLSDGRNLSALVDYCQPGLIPDHASLDPEQRLENVKKAMALAEEHLNIPQLMHPEDLAVDKPDKLSTMTYLSQFCCPNSVGERALLDFIRKKLPSHTVTNFTTDWVDGKLLEALTAELFPYRPQANTSDPTERCKEAMIALESNLSVRRILHASEFTNPGLDPRLRMAYLVDIYHTTKPPRILETHIPDQVGAGQEIIVELETLQQGSIVASAFGTITGPSTVTIEETAANHIQVKIAVPIRDKYTVSITSSGRVIRGCPFVIPLDTYSVPNIESSLPHKVGDACSLTFDTSYTDGKHIETKVTGAISGEVEHNMYNSTANRCILSFIPLFVDTYTVTVTVDKKNVKQSPLVIPLLNMVEPQKVVCGSLVSTGISNPVSMTIDCKKAGKGVLTANCMGKSTGVVPVQINTTDDVPNGITFTPDSEDLFLLQVLYDGGEVPGSPWCIDFRNLPPRPHKVRVIDPPSGSLGLGEELNIVFDTSDAGSSDLTASCNGASCGNIPVSITTVEMDKYRISFIPKAPDNYFLTVSWGGVVIAGSPFQVSYGCQPVNASKCKLVGLAGNPNLVKIRKVYQGILGREMVLQVKTGEAGDGKLEVKIQTPSEEVTVTPQQNADDPHTQTVCFTPTDSGHHSLHMLWGGEAVPGTPIEFEAVSPLTFPLGSPITVEMELEGKKKDLSGEASLQKTGLPEKVQANVEMSNNKKVVLSLESSAMVPGTYVLYVYSKYRELPKSPILLVYGDTEEIKEEGATATEIGATSETILFNSSSDPTAEAELQMDKQKSEEMDGQVENLVDSSQQMLPEPEDPTLLPDPSEVHEKSLTTEEGELNISKPLDEERQGSPQHNNLEDTLVISVEVPPISEAALSLDTSPPLMSPPLQDTSPQPEVQPAIEQTVEELGTASEDRVAGLGEQQQEGDKEKKDDEILEEKKGKKKARDKEEQKSKKKEKEKEKAERAEKEKEEKKKKKEKKKEARLNLEDQEFRVGIRMKYKLHCEDLGTKPPVIICSPREAAKHKVIPATEFGPNTYWCEITPLQEGEMEVSLVYENFHILGSPFSIEVGPRGDASQCNMVEASSTCKKQMADSLLFCISVPESAGRGKLTASVRSASSNKRLHNVLTTGVSNHHYHIEFNPSEGLEYILSVKYDERHIVGSPFTINLGDPTKCKVHGDGVVQAYTEEENTFVVDGTDAGPGEMTVTITGEGKTIEPKVTMTGEKEYRVSYTIKKPGQYRVAVRWGDGHVANSPFQVPCIGASQFRIAESIPQAYAGINTRFQVVTTATEIHHKQLSVFAHPKSDISKMFSGEIEQAEDSTFTCFLRPTEAHIGLCSVHICWNGKEIHGSPYELSVADPPRPGDFSLEVEESNSGDVTIFVNGLTDVFATETVVATVDNLLTGEQIVASVTKLSNEKCGLALLPREGGEYQLSILYCGVHVANSPFALTQADPSQCHISGDAIRACKVNELSKFTVDHSNAGLGLLRVDIVGEDGSTIEPFIAAGESLSEVSYVSQSVGVFKATILWGEYELPSSPFTMYSVDPSKFILCNTPPKHCPVGKTMHFSIQANGPVAEWERLSVTAKLIHQQQVYRGRVEAKKSQKYQCSLDIPETGRYAVYVQCRGIDIQGSPFKIQMMPSPKPDKVYVSGAGLENGIVGQRRQFTIDVREAGYGHIGLKVQGPSSGFAVNMHQHETLEHVIIAEYTPVYPGRYSIHLMWGGLLVPGSPYSVSFRTPKKGEIENHKDNEWVSIKYLFQSCALYPQLEHSDILQDSKKKCCRM